MYMSFKVFKENNIFEFTSMDKEMQDDDSLRPPISPARAPEAMTPWWWTRK